MTTVLRAFVGTLHPYFGNEGSLNPHRRCLLTSGYVIRPVGTGRATRASEVQIAESERVLQREDRQHDPDGENEDAHHTVRGL